MAHLPSLPLLGGMPFLRVASHVTRRRPAPNAPVFTALPSIGGTPQIGQALTGMDGTISGGTVVSRRWLLGAAVVSTGTLYVTTAKGSLVYEVTATGPGGTTVASSAPVTIAAAPSAGSLKSFGPFGFNPDAGEKAPEGNGFVFIDMARSSRPWQTDFGSDPATGVEWVPPTINGNGYPTALNPHKGSCFALINAEGRYVETPGIQKMVMLCSVPDAGLALSDDCTITSNTIVNGVRRFEIDLDPTKSLDLQGQGGFYATTIFLKSLPTPFRCKADGDAVDDYISFFRADNEAKLLAGQEITDQAIARAKKLDGGFRMMDWCWVNQYQDLADYPTRLSWSWAGRVPLATMVNWANLSDVALWLNLPLHVTDAQATAWAMYVEQNLNSHLAHACELSNEVWNFLFVQAHDAYDESQFTTQDGRENWRYGYRATQVMAAYHKGTGYSDRCTPIMGTRQDATTTERIISGSKVAIAEWGTPGNANANPEYAARFWAVGQVFGYIAAAMYLAAGFDQMQLSDADQATVEGWANLSDGGVAMVIDQFRHGGHIPTPLGDYITNLVNVYAPLKVIADREQMSLVAYEANIALQEQKTQAIFNVVYNAIHSPAFEPVMEEFCDAMEAAGVQATMFLTEMGIKNGAYGLLEGPSTFTLPRWAAAVAAQARGPKPLPLSVSVSTDGQTKVGKSPVTHITVLNDWGKAKVEVTGLVDGRGYDGWRGITGSFQQATAQPVTAQVKVTDALGRTVSCDLVQDIGAAPVYPTAKYIRLVANEGFGGDDGNRGFYVQLDAITVVPADGSADIAVTWTGDDQSGYPASNLTVADGAQWVSSGPLNAGPQQVFGVLPASVSIADIAITPTGDLRTCIAKWQLWLSDKPFAQDGSGGTLVLDINEANSSKWTPSTRRLFEVGV